MAGTIEVVNGPVRATFDLNGLTEQTVGQVLDRVIGELNVPAGATPILNGAAVGNDATVEDGDELAFTKPLGEKGRKA